MLRRLHHDQPESFAFTPANLEWAMAQITKYPEGRQASAVIPLLWRAQEQEGWISRKAIEYIAEMLGMADIRVLEVATFYFMFQLHPVGSIAHVQVCGTTSCMICGAEDLMAVCKERIAQNQFEISDDGKFTWEEVECLGACANAPMAMIGKDYYEDLTQERFAEILDEMAAGKVPTPGPQQGRFASEPAGGLTSLQVDDDKRQPHNASIDLAKSIGDTVKRIDGTEVPLLKPWRPAGAAGKQPAIERGDNLTRTPDSGQTPGPQPAEHTAPDATGTTKQEAPVDQKGRPAEGAPAAAASATSRAGETGAASDLPDEDTRQPEGLDKPRDGKGDDLTRIKGIGPKLAEQLNGRGIYHFDQIAGWNEAELAWVDRNIEGFKGRAVRDDWVGQARGLNSDGETDT